METRPSTAGETDQEILPHHPTYNTSLDRDSIVSICAAVLPDQRVTSIERLDHNKAFNNVIYFINTTAPPVSQEPLSRLVLKVPGQIFGPDKIQNEVACLSFFQKHCPTLPVPRLIAWSEDGRNTSKVVRTDSSDSESGFFRLITVDIPEHTVSKPTGWLLETRLQGRPIDQTDLLGPSSTHIIRQIASYITQWRSIAPQDSRIGNFRLLRTERNVDAKSMERAAKPVVQGLLSCEQACADDVFISSLSYYDHMIRDAMIKLQNNVLFELNHDSLGDMIRHFASDILPKLPCFSGNESQTVFTHCDLSPRNFLIADGAEPTVTGIVDFEFSGVFPSETEFATAMVWNAEDWPAQTLSILSGESKSQAPKTMLDKRGANNFDQCLLLVELIDNIAPWWLHDGMSTDELERELGEASAKVRRVISLLERYVR